LVGSVKYFLRSWEILGWAIFISLFAFLVKERVVDLRSIAYGLNYKTEKTDIPAYNYKNLQAVFSKERYEREKQAELHRLDNWKSRIAMGHKPTLVILSVSGGGSRAAFWTFRSLQYADSLADGKLFSHTVMMTGASGGMMGAEYWRGLHDSYREGNIDNPYRKQYQENIAKDLLNSIIFSLASVDMISPFNKISLAGYSYTKDRGYAMEQEMIRNTEGILDKKLGDFKQKELEGLIPMAIINGTVINDGRRLMMCAQPVGYLTQSEYDVRYTASPAIDGVDLATLFHKQNPYNLRLATALRMTATFPYILPVVRLPSEPMMNIMDAGLRDNFGIELSNRYLHTMRNWIIQNVGKVVMLQIRDTRQFEIFPPSDMNTLGKMLADPLFAIQNKWEPFQSYSQGYTKDYLKEYFGDRLEYITLQYIPEDGKKVAALNFHVTAKEQEDLLQSIYKTENQREIQKLITLLGQE
ncbi:MAG: patatin-like phospholipase family protein, partial [Chitinophagaceae bacterium]|nr:patatin-like phospholipase family protein [Chitinophagaceae bacterium]